METFNTSLFHMNLLSPSLIGCFPVGALSHRLTACLFLNLRLPWLLWLICGFHLQTRLDWWISPPSHPDLKDPPLRIFMVVLGVSFCHLFPIFIGMMSFSSLNQRWVLAFVYPFRSATTFNCWEDPAINCWFLQNTSVQKGLWPCSAICAGMSWTRDRGAPHCSCCASITYKLSAVKRSLEFKTTGPQATNLPLVDVLFCLILRSILHFFLRSWVSRVCVFESPLFCDAWQHQRLTSHVLSKLKRLRPTLLGNG